MNAKQQADSGQKIPTPEPAGIDRQLPTHVFAWGNNPRRAEWKGRGCVIEASGRMGSVLVRFVDTEERAVVSRRALRKIVWRRESTAGDRGRCRELLDQLDPARGPSPIAAAIGPMLDYQAYCKAALEALCRASSVPSGALGVGRVGLPHVDTVQAHRRGQVDGPFQ